MNEELWKTLITNLPAIIAAVGGVIAAALSPMIAWWSYKAKMQSTANAAAIESSDKKTELVLEKQDTQEQRWETLKNEITKLGELENERAAKETSPSGR